MKTLGNVMILNYYLHNSSCREEQPPGCWQSLHPSFPWECWRGKGRGFPWKGGWCFPWRGADFNAHSVSHSLHRRKDISTEEKAEIAASAKCGGHGTLGGWSGRIANLRPAWATQQGSSQPNKQQRAKTIHPGVAITSVRRNGPIRSPDIGHRRGSASE